MFDALDIGAAGLTVQRARMDVIAGNIANANTTHDASGKPNPYRRRFAVIAPGAPGDSSKPGVHVEAVKQDRSPFLRRYEPWNQDAGKDGYVNYPNVDPTVEFVNAIEASRAYEANVTMMDVTKSMINASLRLLA
ncbi:MAG TPA: flagellar basal body rod protein FlgC [Tepidisphaeraceae bacterium]|jgi:flagellar basal-body rod protein FlgC